MLCRRKPFKSADGYLIDEQNYTWKWKKVEWVKCNKCRLYHSNRKIPEYFFEREWSIISDPRKKVGILLIRGCYIWLIESYHRCYGFPKGEKDSHETIEECAKREFYEETGTSIQSVNLSKCLKLETNIENINYIFFVLNVNKTFNIKTYPVDDVEITSFGWKHMNEIPKLKLSKAVRRIFYQYINIK